MVPLLSVITRKSNSVMYAIVGSVVGLVIIFMVLLAVLFYLRRRKANDWWCIDEDQIKVVQRDGASRHTSTNSISSFRSNVSGMSGHSTRNRQLHTTTGMYRDQIVAVRRPKNLESKSKIVKEGVIKDFWAIHQLNHPNLCDVYGACLASKSTFLVSEYCSRGSLEDVLQNDELKLDWIVKFSMLNDIATGMKYLHSKFGPHSNLKSSNCLVDSTWKVKIADYGLHSLREAFASGVQENDGSAAVPGKDRKKGPEAFTEGEEGFYATTKKLLWTAPEKLRASHFSIAAVSTREQDVYSFGIILDEIANENMPYSVCEEEPQAIIKKIKDGVRFRPIIPAENCPAELIQVSLNEFIQ